MRIAILIILCIAFLQTTSAQTTFSKTISNYPLDPENAWTVAEVIDGYIVVSAGECLGQDVIICGIVSKLDKNGDIVWFKQFDFYPHINTSLVIHENNIYISGTTNQAEKQFILYCLDMEGNIIWNKKYGSPTQGEVGPTMVFTSDEHILLSGTRMPNKAGMPEQVVCMIKTDMNGNPTGEHTYDFQNDQSLGRTIVETTDRQTVFSYGACPTTCFLESTGGVASVDSAGNLQWNTVFPFAYEPDRPNVVQSDANTLVANWHTPTMLPNHDLEPPTLFYFNMSGQEQVKYVFENQSIKEINDLEAIWDNGLVGSGSNSTNYITDPNPQPGGWVFRMGNNRALLWERTYFDTTFQGMAYRLQSIAPTSDGGYIAVGTIGNRMTGVPESHNWILKLDSMGCLQPGCGDMNYITETEEIAFLKGKDIQVFPNPGDDFVTIRFPNQRDRVLNTHISLVTATGHLVMEQPAGTGDTTLEVSTVPAGFYFILIRQGNEVVLSKKVVIAH